MHFPISMLGQQNRDLHPPPRSCPHHQVCQDMSRTMYVWTPHAGNWEIPEGVGFQINTHPREHFVMQFHLSEAKEVKDKLYRWVGFICLFTTSLSKSVPFFSGSKISLTTTHKKPERIAGIWFQLDKKFTASPNLPDTTVDLNCRARSLPGPAKPFAFRVHTHGKGTHFSLNVSNSSFRTHVRFCRTPGDRAHCQGPFR